MILEQILKNQITILKLLKKVNFAEENWIAEEHKMIQDRIDETKELLTWYAVKK